MTGGVGEIPVFIDELYKTPSVITPHALPPTFVNVISEFGGVVNHHAALTATVSSIEQVAGGRFGCIGQSRSIYESDGVRLLSRDKIGLTVEALALAGQKADDDTDAAFVEVMFPNWIPIDPVAMARFAQECWDIQNEPIHP